MTTGGKESSLWPIKRDLFEMIQEVLLHRMLGSRKRFTLEGPSTSTYKPYGCLAKLLCARGRFALADEFCQTVEKSTSTLRSAGILRRSSQEIDATVWQEQCKHPG